MNMNKEMNEENLTSIPFWYDNTNHVFGMIVEAQNKLVQFKSLNTAPKNYHDSINSNFHQVDFNPIFVAVDKVENIQSMWQSYISMEQYLHKQDLILVTNNPLSFENMEIACRGFNRLINNWKKSKNPFIKHIFEEMRYKPTARFYKKQKNDFDVFYYLSMGAGSDVSDEYIEMVVFEFNTVWNECNLIVDISLIIPDNIPFLNFNPFRRSEISHYQNQLRDTAPELWWKIFNNK